MEMVHPICCGLDVHQASVVACLRRSHGRGQVSLEHETFGATYQELLRCSDWLTQAGCPIVAMESSGVYWKPVFHVLSGIVDVVVGNARDIRPRPGRKTDKRDAAWIAELLAHGLIRPSFVPPPHICALRDVTRTRVGLVQARTQTKNRIHKLLEDTNIKLSSVVADLFGKSARRMLDALVTGERDPKVLAELAIGRLRPKVPALELALTGQFTDHHAHLLKLMLDLVDVYDAHIAELDRRIGEIVEPITTELELLQTIPGVQKVAARDILAEIGTDMTRFVSAKRLASWARVCPGMNESAGKRHSSRTGKGNRYLRRVLVQCAWATRKTDSFLGQMFRRLQARIGGKKAAVAVAHRILVIAYHLLRNGVPFNEQLRDRPNPAKVLKHRKRLVKALEQLGYDVALSPASA